MHRRSVGWLTSGAIMLAIVAVIVLLVVFQGVQRGPAASPRQQYRSQSIFTQAGRAFSAHTGFVTISLAADRPSASKLGLPSSGDTTAAYSDPLTVSVSAGGDSVQLQLVQGVDILTAGGKITEVLFSTEQPYDEQFENATELIAAAGTTADLAAFTAALQQTRAESNQDSYSATQDLDGGGMSTRVELSGSQGLAKLAIRITPAS
ncbi:MAG: hypothetical protein JWN80_2672 [Microbacteriaceae bacterium]|nr:hypothetical protein [Microbacteriaceae bacterium]